jgi:hypothetical protein
MTRDGDHSCYSRLQLYFQCILIVQLTQIDMDERYDELISVVFCLCNFL